MLKTLAINSLPAFGDAGLKCVLSVLQTRVVPVPSLILSGLGNVKGHRRYLYDFQDNLCHTLEHLIENEDKIIIYIGYLDHADQIAQIKKVILRFRQHIEHIIIDPVAGDNGQAYVPEAIISDWPALLELADWATPNITEVKLLTQQQDLDEGISQLCRRFKDTNWIVTSYPTEPGKIANRLITKDLKRDYTTEHIPQKISGAGDTFTSQFIKAFFYEQHFLEEAVDTATARTFQILSDG